MATRLSTVAPKIDILSDANLVISPLSSEKNLMLFLEIKIKIPKEVSLVKEWPVNTSQCPCAQTPSALQL